MWYARLLRLYPARFRDRFGEGLEQTFADLYRERAVTGRSLAGFLLWAFSDTFIAILTQHLNNMRSPFMTARLLKTVRVTAIALGTLMVLGIITVMILARGTGEDITGVVAPALLLTIVSVVVATVTFVLQKRAA